MSEDKLQSMTDFVLEVEKEIVKAIQSGEQLSNYTSEKRLRKIFKRVHFLKQPLKLGMFIPCDEDDKPLEEPKFPTGERRAYDGLAELYDYQLNEYQQAKERVLFKGFEVKEFPERLSFFINDRVIITYSSTKGDFLGHKPTIERVCNFNLTLTPNAIKQLGL